MFHFNLPETFLASAGPYPMYQDVAMIEDSTTVASSESYDPTMELIKDFRSYQAGGQQRMMSDRMLKIGVPGVLGNLDTFLTVTTPVGGKGETLQSFWSAFEQASAEGVDIYLTSGEEIIHTVFCASLTKAKVFYDFTAPDRKLSFEEHSEKTKDSPVLCYDVP